MPDAPLLLVLSNSADGTSDVLVEIAREAGQSVLRWNIDLWRHYDTHFDGHRFLLGDPTGRIANVAADNILLLWRKPFLEQMELDDPALQPEDQEQGRIQMGQWLRTVVALAKGRHRLRLIEPYADRRLPKLLQLYIAKDFFTVPRSDFAVVDHQRDFGPNVVTKPLGDPAVGDQKVLYTRRVDASALIRPFPWFIQEALTGGEDVTCAYILGKSQFFVSDFERGEDAIDWRVEINSPGQSPWHALEHPRLLEWEESVGQFMKRLGLHYGRLDFILKDDTLFFLECNSNGQFGWLDDPKSLALHRDFFSATLDPAATVL